MKSYLPAVTFGIALTAGALAFGVATAHASVDYANQGAAQVAGDLTALGYSVQINGSTDGSLTGCAVTGVDGLTAVPSGTAYITVDCPSSNN